MAVSANTKGHTKVIKRTKQGGSKVGRAGMNKNEKRSFKAYRGQGR